jgi:hypothetical protein
MIDEDLMFLQNCMDFVKVAPSSQSNTWLTSDCGCQFNDIKAEYITDIQQQEDPLLIAYPVIKSEREVSCVCALLRTFHVLC